MTEVENLFWNLVTRSRIRRNGLQKILLCNGILQKTGFLFKHNAEDVKHKQKDYRNRNRKLQTSKAPLKSQAQGTSLFTSAASNQRGFPKNSPWEAQVRFPEGERMRQIRGVFQRIVRGKLRSGCQNVRGGRLGVKAGVV